MYILGAKDPRLNSANLMDFRLQKMVASWKKTNPALDRVKPIPIKVIKGVAILAQHATSQQIKAIADMIIIAFFFLL